MKRRLRQFIFIIISGCILLGLGGLPGWAAEANIQIEAERISVGDIVQFRIIVDSFSGNQPEVNQLDGLKIDYLGSSSSFQLINGQRSSTQVFTYVITAVKPGAYTIGPYEVTSGGKRISTNTVKLTVARGSASTNASGNSQGAAPNPGKTDSQLFFTFSIPKTKIYLGEKIPVKFRIYVGDVRINGPLRSLDFNQSEVLLDTPVKSSESDVTIDGQLYRMTEFTGTLSPVKTGAFTLGPAKMVCDVMVRKRVSSFFDFDDGYVRRTVQIDSNNSAKLNVLPLPNTGRPAAFSGGIGRFQLSASAGPTEVLQGDPITLKMTVTGSGNCKTIMPPRLATADGFKVYDAQRKENSGPGVNPENEATFEQVLIPLDPKLKQISPLVLSYFDPDAGVYREARTAPIRVTVKPNPNFNTAATLSGATASEEDEQLGQDIIYIKDHPGQMQFNPKPLYGETWFWLLQLIPVIGLLGAFCYRKNQELLLADTPESRALRATNKASQRLKTARELKEGRQFTELLEELHLTIRQYLGEKFNLPAAGMTVKVVEVLETKGIPAAILEQIKAYFERYDYYCFTGTTLNPDTAQELWDQVEGIIIGLENWKKSKVKSKAGKTLSTRGEIHGKN